MTEYQEDKQHNKYGNIAQVGTKIHNLLEYVERVGNSYPELMVGPVLETGLMVQDEGEAVESP